MDLRTKLIPRNNSSLILHFETELDEARGDWILCSLLFYKLAVRVTARCCSGPLILDARQDIHQLDADAH